MATKKYPLILVLLLCGYILLDSSRVNAAAGAKRGRKKPKPSKTTRQNGNSDPCKFSQAAWAPLCGSDGAVYLNPVHLKCSQKENPDLQRADPSQCPDFAEQRESMRFIVASDPGTTNTKRIKKPTKPKKKRGMGRRIMKGKICKVTMEYAPTCGSDGTMYGNPRALRCAQRDNPDLREVDRSYCLEGPEGNDSMGGRIPDNREWVEKPKEENPCVVFRNRRPTCGSDGKLYINQSSFRCAQKRNPDLHVVDRSNCPSDEEW